MPTNLSLIAVAAVGSTAMVVAAALPFEVSGFQNGNLTMLGDGGVVGVLVAWVSFLIWMWSLEKKSREAAQAEMLKTLKDMNAQQQDVISKHTEALKGNVDAIAENSRINRSLLKTLKVEVVE